MTEGVWSVRWTPPSAPQATPSHQVWSASHLQIRPQPLGRAPAPGRALVPSLALVQDPFGVPTPAQPLQRSQLPALAQFPRGFRIALPRSPQDPTPHRNLKLWAARGMRSLSQLPQESSGLGMEGRSFVLGSLRRRWECLRFILLL